MITYPIMDISELNTILNDPKENHLVASILWLAQCTVLSSIIPTSFTTTARMERILSKTLGCICDEGSEETV